MIIACPSCATRFKIDAARIPEKGAKLRCAKCAHVWLHVPEKAPEAEASPPAFGGFAAPAQAPARSEDREEAAAPPAPEPAPAAPPARAPQAEEPFPFPVREPAPERAPFAARAREPAARPYTPVAESEEPRPTGRWVLRLAFGALALFVVAGLAAGYVLRVEIVRAFPRMAVLYGLAGIEVNVVGIDFRNVTAASGFENGAPALMVEGEIVNTSRRRVAVPELKASIKDGSGRELSHWTFEAFADSLGPQEVSAFASPRLPLPPGAVALELRFAAKE
jgi:predicted Zn finger-like uncharacterized protein